MKSHTGGDRSALCASSCTAVGSLAACAGLLAHNSSLTSRCPRSAERGAPPGDPGRPLRCSLPRIDECVHLAHPGSIVEVEQEQILHRNNERPNAPGPGAACPAQARRAACVRPLAQNIPVQAYLRHQRRQIVHAFHLSGLFSWPLRPG